MRTSPVMRVCLLAVLPVAAVLVWAVGDRIVAAGANSITSPDPDSNVGQWDSLVLDASGYPVVSYAKYYDEEGADLKVMHCNDANCAGGDESITSPDTEGAVGGCTSLALDSLGYPVVSHVEEWSGDLKVMHCNDANCAGGDESSTSPDTEGYVGLYTSLALDSSGYPVVSYYDKTNEDLKVMHCNDANCAGGDESITSPDTEGNVGWYTSLALDGSGYPVVSYLDVTNYDLKVMHCNDANCSGGDESIASPATEASFSGMSSLALDASGNPVVSYNGKGNLVVMQLMHCNDANCAGGDESITSPDTEGNAGGTSSLVLDGSGYPVVSYMDRADWDLKVMHCNDANCAGGDESITSPDWKGYVGQFASLALDSSGYPVVSYHDATNSNLKLLHCGDANCSAWVGGIAEPPELEPHAVAGEGHTGNHVAVAASGAVSAVILLAAGAWYARRRWLT